MTDGSDPRADEPRVVRATRGEFVRTIAGAAGMFGLGLMAAPVYRYLASPALDTRASSSQGAVTLDGADGLAPGEALMFAFNARPAVLLHHVDGSWRAFDAVCTHLDCTVQYQPEQGRILCACHQGVFDPLSGEVVSGPPVRALESYAVEVSSGRVVVSRR